MEASSGARFSPKTSHGRKIARIAPILTILGQNWSSWPELSFEPHFVFFSTFFRFGFSTFFQPPSVVRSWNFDVWQISSSRTFRKNLFRGQRSPESPKLAKLLQKFWCGVTLSFRWIDANKWPAAICLLILGFCWIIMVSELRMSLTVVSPGPESDPRRVTFRK